MYSRMVVLDEGLAVAGVPLGAQQLERHALPEPSSHGHRPSRVLLRARFAFSGLCVRDAGATFELDYYRHVFDISEIMGSGDAAWQPW